MTNFVSLIFIWLLSLKSSTVNSDQNHNFRSEVENKYTKDQLTTHEASSFNPLSEDSRHDITQSFIVDVNPTEAKATKHSTKRSLQTTRTTPSKTFLPNIKTTATPTSSVSSQINSSTVGEKSMTEVQFQVTKSANTMVTSQASNPTTTPILGSSTQSQGTGKTSTSQFTSDKSTHPSTRPTQSTNLTSTTTTLTKPAEIKSTSTSTVTGRDATQSTGLYKTSTATSKTPFIHITTAKKRQDPSEKDTSQKGANHSKAVAGLIGGALILMMVGLLVIYIKKQKHQKQQITTRDWAGPSPFLEGGVDNSQVTLRSSNQISLSSFLPQRLSKKLSFLPETDEELENMISGTTFGNENQRSTFGRAVDGNDVQESNGTAVVVSEIKNTGDAAETVEKTLSVSSSQTNDPLSTNNNLEVANLSQDHPANPPTLSAAAENALVQLNDGPGKP